MRKTIRIGTRASALALWQAEYVRDRLLAEHSGLEVELVTMTTKGDKILDTRISMKRFTTILVLLAAPFLALEARARAEGYVRYMDDMLIWGESAGDLKFVLNRCRGFLADKLQLERGAHGVSGQPLYFVIASGKDQKENE